MEQSEEYRSGLEHIKHLEFIQAVVTRLGSNSFFVKGWTLTIAAAFFAVTVNDLSWEISLVALVPITAFWFLDAYYLQQERAFRRLYDAVRLREEEIKPFSMQVGGYLTRGSWAGAAFSRTIVIFYLPLIVIDAAFIISGATVG